MDISQNYPGQPLKSELARYCLPGASQDPNRKVAWVNSICLLFLVIGVVGARQTSAYVKPPPPLEEVVPAVLEPLPPPPTRIEAQMSKEEAEPQKEAMQPVIAVTLNTPAVNFSVPTIGGVLVPLGRAMAPPSAPLNSLVAARNEPVSIGNTGKGGDRPEPPYPPLAEQLHQQGTVVLSMVVDENGGITRIEVKQSSGSSILDHGSLEFVKRHWILPAGANGRIFEAPIRYIY